MPALALATAVGIGAAGAAAAERFLATRTGHVVSAQEALSAGPGEDLRLNGSGLDSVAAELVADIPLPEGYAPRRAEILRGKAFQRIEPDPDGSEYHVTTSVLRSEFAKAAVCAWTDAWGSGGPGSPQRAAASAGLQALLDSSAVRDIDPNPSPTCYQGDQGATSTVFGFLPGVVDAAEAGDLAAMQARTEAANICNPPWPGAERDISKLLQASR